MQNYYKHKFQHPEWYITNEKVTSFKAELDQHLHYMIDGEDRTGKRLFISKLGKPSSNLLGLFYARLL